MNVIYSVLETELSAATDSRVTAVWRDDMRKVPLLQADLAFFEPKQIANAPDAIEAALHVVEAIRLCQVTTPHALLGCLYVMEGTTLGNWVHRPDIVKTFHLDSPAGSHYYSGYGESVRTHWQGFVERMNAALVDESLHEPVIDAARDVFASLIALHAKLFPLEEMSSSLHVTQINPEAGNHSVPDDPREIDAAFRASGRAWAEFPYYQLRFSGRGRRFSDSDICWLVTLTSLELEETHQQINWLNRVLASRGMPSVMLEQTLRILHEELVAAIPDQQERYDKLLDVADTFRARRLEHLPDEEARPLIQAFEQAVGPELAKTYPDAGLLLACAVADTLGGIDEALPSLRSFLEDEEHFPNQWLAAVHTMVVELGAGAPQSAT
jgi:heme oxygenase